MNENLKPSYETLMKFDWERRPILFKDLLLKKKVLLKVHSKDIFKRFVKV